MKPLNVLVNAQFSVLSGSDQKQLGFYFVHVVVGISGTPRSSTVTQEIEETTFKICVPLAFYRCSLYPILLCQISSALGYE